MSHIKTINHDNGHPFCRWIDLFARTLDALNSPTSNPQAKQFIDTWATKNDKQRIDLAADLLRPRFFLSEMLDRIDFDPTRASHILLNKDRANVKERWCEVIDGEQTVSGVGVWHVLMLLNNNRHNPNDRRLSLKDRFPLISQFCSHIRRVVDGRSHRIEGAVSRIEEAISNYRVNQHVHKLLQP